MSENMYFHTYENMVSKASAKRESGQGPQFTDTFGPARDIHQARDLVG